MKTAVRTMVEVEVHNFQSIEQAKVQIDGFTVLVGRSNLGKSSIVRAIQCALTAASGTDFVRHGSTCERRTKGLKKCKCFASVRIRTSALDLTWEKGDTVNRYKVLRAGEKETTVYDKVGQGTPEFLQPAFCPVQIGSSQELIQVSEQFSPIFLLNQSGNAIADVLSDVAKLDEINLAMGLVAKDRKADVATRKVREQDILKLGKALEAYSGLDDVLADVERVEKLQGGTETAGALLEQLDGFLGKARTLTLALKALKDATTPSLPEGPALEAMASKAVTLKAYCETATIKSARIKKLRGIEETRLPDDASIRAALEKSSRIEAWLAQLQGFKDKLSRWQGLEKQVLPDPSPISTGLGNIARMQGLLDRLVKVKTSLAQVQQQLTLAEAEEKHVLEEIQGLGICPTCSQNIEASRCLHLDVEFQTDCSIRRDEGT
jgi:hypothetical protein